MTSWQLAVDLGTSFCCAAARHADRVDVLEVNGSRRIPSAVLLLEDGELAAGTYAVNSAGRIPDRYERNPKRYAGRPPMLLGGMPITAARAFQALLELFLAEGRRAFDGALPDALVLTHPVAWAQRRRDVLGEAAAAALPEADLLLVEEPVAAAVHYATEHDLMVNELVSVYDLGGGTFDCVALQATADGFSSVGPPGGDDEIGGERFDEILFEHFGRQLAAADPEGWAAMSTGTTRDALRFRTDLLAEAQLAKEELSEYESAYRVVRGMDRDVTLTRGELQELVGPLVSRTVDLMSATLTRAEIDPSQLKSVFLTGGASRMPLVRDLVRERFGGLTRTWADPKTVVALGAVRLAPTHRLPRRNTPPPVDTPSLEDPPLRPPEPEPDERSQPRPLVSAAIEGGLTLLLGDVFEAALVGDRVYAWAALPGAGGAPGLVRLDAHTGVIDRQLPLDNVLAWAAGDRGLLVAARQGPNTIVSVISPELVIRSSRIVRTPGIPSLSVFGSIGYAAFDTRRPEPVDNTMGLPWGAITMQALLRIDLESLFPRDEPPYVIGVSTNWYVNEDGQRRRLLVPAGAGGWPLVPLGDGGCAVIRGQFNSQLGKRPFRSLDQGIGWHPLDGLRKRRHEAVIPWQLLELIGPAGPGEQRERREPPWWTQVVRVADTWYTATTAGLCLGGVEDAPTLLWPQPPAGAARWLAAPEDALYAIGVDQLLPAGGLRVWALRGTDLVPLVEEPASRPVGHLTASDPLEQVKAHADGTGLLLASTASDGGAAATRVHAFSDGALLGAVSVPGRLEPVGRMGAELWCLYQAEGDPRALRTDAASLVRLPLRDVR